MLDNLSVPYSHLRFRPKLKHRYTGIRTRLVVPPTFNLTDSLPPSLPHKQFPWRPENLQKKKRACAISHGPQDGVTMYPSEEGYHLRSKSPTFRLLCDAREELFKRINITLLERSTAGESFHSITKTSGKASRLSKNGLYLVTTPSGRMTTADSDDEYIDEDRCCVDTERLYSALTSRHHQGCVGPLATCYSRPSSRAAHKDYQWGGCCVGAAGGVGSHHCCHRLSSRKHKGHIACKHRGGAKCQSNHRKSSGSIRIFQGYEELEHWPEGPDLDTLVQKAMNCWVKKGWSVSTDANNLLEPNNWKRIESINEGKADHLDAASALQSQEPNGVVIKLPDVGILIAPVRVRFRSSLDYALALSQQIQDGSDLTSNICQQVVNRKACLEDDNEHKLIKPTPSPAGLPTSSQSYPRVTRSAAASSGGGVAHRQQTRFRGDDRPVTPDMDILVDPSTREALTQLPAIVEAAKRIKSAPDLLEKRRVKKRTEEKEELAMIAARLKVEQEDSYRRHSRAISTAAGVSQVTIKPHPGSNEAKPLTAPAQSIQSVSSSVFFINNRIPQIPVESSSSNTSGTGLRSYHETSRACLAEMVEKAERMHCKPLHPHHRRKGDARQRKKGGAKNNKGKEEKMKGVKVEGDAGEILGEDESNLQTQVQLVSDRADSRGDANKQQKSKLPGSQEGKQNSTSHKGILKQSSSPSKTPDNGGGCEKRITSGEDARSSLASPTTNKVE